MNKKCWVIGILLILLLAIIPANTNSENPPGWTDDSRLTSVDDYSSQKPRIAVDSFNNLHIAYNDFRHGPPELYYMKLDSEGNVLVDEKAISDLDAATSDIGDIAIDSNDNIHIVWHDVRDSGPLPNIEIYYEKLDVMGNTLVDDLRITDVPYNSMYPVIAVDSLDNLHVAWVDERDFGGFFQEEIFYKKLDNNGDILVDDIPITDADDEESLFPDIQIDYQDNVHIVWLDDRNETGTGQNQDVWYSKLNNDGETIVDDTKLFHAGDFFKPSIIVDSNDLIHLICGGLQRKGTDFRQLYYMKLDNNGFPIVDEKRITNDQGNATHQVIEIDPLNNIYIVWEDERHNNSEIYYMRVDDNGNILDDELRLTDNMSRSQLPQIVMNHEYKLNVVWDDARDYVDTGASELYYKRTLEPAINFPPTIQITYPSLGQTVSGEIEIEGTASDSDGSVEFVQIKINSGSWETALGTDNFIFPWDTTSVSDGAYTIHARSYDGTDFSQEDNIYVIVNNTEPPPQPNNPPTILITPLQEDEVSGTVLIQGTASDSDGSVEKVHIKINSGGWRAVSGTNSWSYSWDTSEEGDGEHVIYARAEDDMGEYSTLDSISVVVNNTENSPPIVNIIYPTGGTVSGFVQVIGTASDVDGDGTLSVVQVSIRGSWENAEGTASWAYIWDTTEDDEGNYEIRARAFDGFIYSEIESVTVTVDNPHAPTITMFTEVPDTVSGTFTITGTSSDSDGEIRKIEIQIDSGDWILVTTSNDWEYDIKTEDLTNDIHTVSVRAIDDEGDSDILIFTIIVKNEEQEIPWETILILIFLIIIFFILLAARRRLRSKRLSQPKEAFNLQTLKCPQCTSVFKADSSSSNIACPNCGYSANS